MSKVTFFDILEAAERGDNSLGMGLPLDFLDDEEYLSLTRIQQRFIIGYSFKGLGGFTKARAYKFAVLPKEIKDQSCHVASMQMFHHDIVKKYLRRIDKLYIESFGTIREIVMEQETAIATAEILDYLDKDGYITWENLQKIPPTLKKAIKELEVVTIGDDITKYKIKTWDKGASIARLQKMGGMYAPDKVEHSGTVVNINAEADPKEAAKLYSEMMKGE